MVFNTKEKIDEYSFLMALGFKKKITKINSQSTKTQIILLSYHMFIGYVVPCV